MNASASKKLHALLRRLRGLRPRHVLDTVKRLDDADDLLHELVYSMLLWESTCAQAARGVARLRDEFVDLNEVRVSVESDLIETLAETHPLARERAQRICSALRDIHARHNALTLAPLRTMPPRDALAQLHAIHGVPDFAAARVALVCLNVHAVPVDTRLRDCFAASRIIPAATEPADLARWLEQQIPHAQCAEACALLQQWSDHDGVLDAARTRPAPRAARKPGAPRRSAKPRLEGE